MQVTCYEEIHVVQTQNSLATIIRSYSSKTTFKISDCLSTGNCCIIINVIPAPWVIFVHGKYAE